jgi:hypothetical protein
MVDILASPTFEIEKAQIDLEELFKDIESKSVRIDHIAKEVASGITTGSDKIFRISKEWLPKATPISTPIS